MEKTPELKRTLAETFSKRFNWNRFIEINGERFIYISARNEVRREEKHYDGSTAAVLVGCFVFVGNETPIGNFFWCC